MAIDDNTTYGLTGAQIKELPAKIDAVKGMAKELTTADYNYPANNPQGVAAWLLPNGTYTVKQGETIYLYMYTGSSFNTSGRTFTVGTASSTNRIIVDFAGGYDFRVYTVGQSGSRVSERQYLKTNDVINDLNSALTSDPLSANQGKVLNDKIGGDLSNLTTTDKSSLINAINEVAGAGGGGGVTELTTDDYNWNSAAGSATEPYDCVALWLLNTGVYSNPSGVNILQDTSASIFTGKYVFVVSSDNNYWAQILVVPTNASTYILQVSKSSGALNSSVLLEAPVQTTGTSTAQVMSQNAVTSMVFADPSTRRQVRIGAGASANGSTPVAIGSNCSAGGNKAVALGPATNASADGSVALGANSSATMQGEVAIGTSQTSMGYNSSNYRLITGVYDPQSAHDAANKQYVDNSIPATFTTNEWNALWA